MTEDAKCDSCQRYRVLNQRHIINGKTFRSCDSGETPDSCGSDYLKKPEDYERENAPTNGSQL